MQKFLVLLASICLLLISTVSAHAQESPAAMGHKVVPCPMGTPLGEIEGETILCGQIQVPEDWSKPDGRLLTISYARLVAKATVPFDDPVIYFEGGPGGTALGSMLTYLQAYERLREDRDVILWDQRGTRYSSQLYCADDARVQDRAAYSAAFPEFIQQMLAQAPPVLADGPQPFLERERKIRAFDQIANQAAAMRYMFGGQAKLPIVFMTQNGGGIGAGPHHSQAVHPLFMHLPLIKVVMPSTPYDVKGLLKAAIRDDNPVVFLNHLALGGQRGEVPDTDYLVPLGQADIKRVGSDVTIVAAGLMVHHALTAATELAAQGIEAEVIDLRTLKPWDEATVLASVARTGRCVVVDESYPICGGASEWAACISEHAFHHLKAPVQRVSSAHVPIPFSPVLEKMVIPQPADIIAAVQRIAAPAMEARK